MVAVAQADASPGIGQTEKPVALSPPPVPAGSDALLADTIGRYGNDPDFVTALARGLTVLLTLSDKRRRMSIAQVSHRTGIPRAAARNSAS
jgi:IclR family pca regulon transcriptional regulator